MNLCMHEWVCTFVCVVLERRKISLERQMTTIKGNKDICQHTTLATCKKTQLYKDWRQVQQLGTFKMLAVQ